MATQANIDASTRDARALEAGAREARALEAQALRFSGAIILLSLLLQRIAIPAGGAPLNVMGPLGLGLVVWGLIRGTLVFDRFRLLLFVALAGWTFLDGLVWVNTPDRFGIPLSWASLAHFLALTAFATVTFSRPVDEARFLRVVTGCFAIIGIAGIAQFVAQFAGAPLFTFTGILPDNILGESSFNTVIQIGNSGYHKSNGFFLGEPSIFSQVMALGIIIEILQFRRLLFLGLFAAGLICSASGTGWLVLLVFVVSATFQMGRRGVLIAGITVGAGAVALTAFALALPDVFATFASRTNEINTAGSSGHDRFVTPFWLMHDVFVRAPWSAAFGVGSGVGERLSMPYEFVVNTPSKLAVEFGLPAMCLYLVLLVLARRSPMQSALLVPCAFLVLFAGAYQQFAPILFSVLLMISIARLRTVQRRPLAAPAAAPSRMAWGQT